MTKDEFMAGDVFRYNTFKYKYSPVSADVYMVKPNGKTGEYVGMVTNVSNMYVDVNTYLMGLMTGVIIKYSDMKKVNNKNNMKAEPTVLIVEKEYIQLLADKRMLDALIGAGVDNWDGFDDACESLEH